MSTLRANTISDAAGTGPSALTGQWAAKAGLLYNQVTPAATRGDNITSVTDDAAGDFTVNLTNSFDAADYLTVLGTDDDASATAALQGDITNGTRAAGSFGAETFTQSSTINRTMTDADETSIACFGDLA